MPYSELRKKVHKSLKLAEAELVSPERRIPEGVTSWQTTYKFNYSKGRVRITLAVINDIPTDSTTPT